MARPGNDDITEPTVSNASEQKRYEVTTLGVRAGLAAYVDTHNQRIFYHTEIDENFAGRGLASKLIAAALADTRAAGKRIVAICPFVAAYVDKHDDYDDILDPITPQAHAAVRAETS
jgi:predicted GNAT family acetyltransferase